MSDFTPAVIGGTRGSRPAEVKAVPIPKVDLERFWAWDAEDRRQLMGEVVERAPDPSVVPDPSVDPVALDRARVAALPVGGCGSGTWGPEVPRATDAVMQEFPQTRDSYPATPAELARRRGYARRDVAW